MKASKAQLEAQRRFDNDPTKTKRYSLKFNMSTDADIISRLESVESKQGYIKELIRRDMEGKI